MVDSTSDAIADDGFTSLREAIIEANVNPGPDTIEFDIPTDDPWFYDSDGDGVKDVFVIQPQQALPALTDDGTTIDGRLAVDTNLTGPDIVLYGVSAGTGSDGLRIVSNDNVVQGLNIVGFNGNGITIDGGSGNVISGNYVGIHPTKTEAWGNAKGVLITGNAANNLIGTDGDGLDDVEERNVISGNNGAGLAIETSNDNVVAGNYIGTVATGTGVLGNAGEGVVISDGAQWNRIGTNGDGQADSAERNVISGNAQDGVHIHRADYNVVAGNYIGTDVTGGAAVANGGAAGVRVDDAARWNRIGTDPDGVGDQAERNVISGNAGRGVAVFEAGTDENIIAGNYIGTDVTGLSALGNALHGVSIAAGPRSTRIGTNGDGLFDEVERNLISGNGTWGVGVSEAEGSIIAGNYIGTDVTGTRALGNGESGVGISTGARFSRIGTNGDGTADAAERNVISGNDTYGVSIMGTGAADNVVAGNFIGTDVTGMLPLGNIGDGVFIKRAQSNQIGLTEVFLEDSGQVVVEAEHFSSRASVGGRYWQIVFGEEPGTVLRSGARGAEYLQVLPDTGGANGVSPPFGLGPDVSYRVRIGTPGEYQLYARWDGHDGGSDSLYASILELRDGTGGQADWYRFAHGADADFTTIPWEGVGEFEGTSGAGNNVAALWTIAQPGDYTIQFIMREDGASLDAFVLELATMSAPAGDGPVESLVVMGDPAVLGNTIAFNSGAGVGVLAADTTGNTIRANSVYSNTGLGIDLGNDGVTENDLGDADIGPNNLQNFPAIESVTVEDGQTTVLGTLNSLATTTFTLDFYANSEVDPSGYGQGERWLGSTMVTTDESGNAEFDVDLAETIGTEWITATATDPDGNTSEFSHVDPVPVVYGTQDNDSLLVEEGAVDGEIKVTITNQEGTEEFYVSGGRVWLYGLGGDDTFTVNALPAGGIYLDGSEQNDVFELNASDGGPVTILDLAGDDEVTINAAPAAGVTADLGEGDDHYTVYFGDVHGPVTIDDSGTMGTDELDVNGTGSPDRLEKTTGTVTFQPLDDPSSPQIVLTFSNIEDVTVRGAEGGDTIVDPGANTTILGGPGDDTILVDATFGNGLLVDGEEGADTVVVQLGELAGPVTVIDTGTTGTTTIRIVGTDADDQMTLTASQLTAGGEVVYLDLGSGETDLILDGGAGHDLVTIEGSLPEGVTTQLMSAAQTVEVDVKPDSSTNLVNLLSSGVIPVALLTTADFDAGKVDVSSVRFVGAAAVQHAFEDLDGDGDLDLILHFRIQDTLLDEAYVAALVEDLADGVLDSNHQEIEATLLGLTTDGTLFEGTDILDAFYAGKALQEVLLGL